MPACVPESSPTSPDWPQHPPMADGRVFLDHAAVAPISEPAAEALRQYAEQASKAGYLGQDWYRRVKEIRKAIATMIGAESYSTIAFVPNTSTGLATAAEGLTVAEGDEVIITGVEYPANRYPWENLKRKGVKLIEISQREDGRIPPEDVIAKITSRTRVVSLSLVQYATGYAMDVKPIADAVHAVGGYLCLDAIQAVGVMPVDVQALGADFLAADGHKWLLGPEGAGFLYVRESLAEALRPPVVGWLSMVNATNYGDYQFEFWPDARRFEPGTWNIPGILALGASVEWLNQLGIDKVWAKVERLTAMAEAGLCELGCSIVSPRGDGERSGIVCFTPPPEVGVEPHDLRRIQAELLKRGFVVAVREGRLRVSPHVLNSVEQVVAFLDVAQETMQ